MIPKIAVFASGNGSNAQNIAEYFNKRKTAIVDSFFTNNPKAYVIERAKALKIPYFIFNKQEFYHSEKIINLLKQRGIQYIVLAGFLWLIPQNILKEFSQRVINIHPALLPAYGGKGMYGQYVHKAVIKNKEKISGITIHIVNEEYDKGKILFQATCPVYPDDTPKTLEKRVHQLEYHYYPLIIEKLINNKI